MSNNTQFTGKPQSHESVILPNEGEYAYYTATDGNFYKVDSDGVKQQINPKAGYQIVLLADSWINKIQELAAPGVESELTEVLISPTSKTDKINWNNSDIFASYLDPNVLSFECSEEIPLVNITLNIKIL